MKFLCDVHILQSNEELVQIFSSNLEYFKSLNNNEMFIVEIDKTSIQYNT
jgi:hypothetical protein